MAYLQFFADYAPYLEPFDDAERGRLLTAMLAYAFDGTEPDFDGNERFIWPVFRKMIDQSKAALEKKQSAGRSAHAGGAAPEGMRRGNGQDIEAERACASEAQGMRSNASSGEQTEAPASTAEQSAAPGSSAQHAGANGHMNQDTRIKNQDSKDKNQDSGTQNQGLSTHDYPSTTRDSRARGPDGRKWYDPKNPDAAFDDGWKTSDRARASIAQRIIDAAGPLTGKPYHDLLGMLTRLMSNGMPPNEIQRQGANAATWLLFAAQIAQAGYRNPAWRNALSEEEVARFIPPAMWRGQEDTKLPESGRMPD